MDVLLREPRAQLMARGESAGRGGRGTVGRACLTAQTGCGGNQLSPELKSSSFMSMSSSSLAVPAQHTRTSRSPSASVLRLLERGIDLSGIGDVTADRQDTQRRAGDQKGNMTQESPS